MAAEARPHAIALMGPTASGKTAYALDLAQRLNGEIISVDSALVYRGLDIGAAKPTREEQARVPHHLVDVREPWQPYSAAEFATDARVAIDGIVARGRIPILAGGTGLYFRALLEGLADMPHADENVRAGITAGTALPGGAIVLVDQAGGIALSRDGGQGFQPVPALQPMPYFGVAALGAQRIGLVGAAGARLQALANEQIK